MPGTLLLKELDALSLIAILSNTPDPIIGFLPPERLSRGQV
jgi:hypothetical protein